MGRGQSGRTVRSSSPSAVLRASDRMVTDEDLLALNVGSDDETLSLPRLGLEVRVADGFSALTAVGLDQMENFELLGRDEDLAAGIWRMRFADGADCLVAIAGLDLSAYCSCGVCPCGHRIASVEVALADDVEMADAIEATSVCIAASQSGDRLSENTRRAYLKEACSLLAFSTREYAHAVRINLDSARLQRMSGAVVARWSRPTVSGPRSVAEAMRRR